MLKLPSIISDGMVIEKTARLWGLSDAPVDVTWQGVTRTATPDERGEWEIWLDSADYGTGYELTIGGVTIRDVSVGVVWLCGGQSNMELPISRVRRKFADELKTADFPHIHAFNVAKSYKFDAPQPLDAPMGTWKPAINANLDEFFATSYFFAVEMYNNLNIPSSPLADELAPCSSSKSAVGRPAIVPVGLINCAAGGSTVEAWLSEEALKPFPKQAEELKKLQITGFVANIERDDQQRSDQWHANVNAKDVGLRRNWQSPETSPEGWLERPLFAPIEQRGVTWWRKTVTLTANQAKTANTLSLGRVKDAVEVFINGQMVGTVAYEYPPAIFPIPPNVLKEGENVLVVRVISRNGTGGFCAGKKYAIECTEEDIDIQQGWLMRSGVITGHLDPAEFYFRHPAGLYNAMLSPVIRHSVSGMLWYQGESNDGDAEGYPALMTAFIKQFRRFAGERPFIFAQLPNWDGGRNWPKLREAQAQALKEPQTAMIAAIDCGENNDLHPLDKKTVGRRLALAALGKALLPVAEAAKRVDDEIVISFTNAKNGLTARFPALIEVEDIDGDITEREAQVRGDSVVVSAEGLSRRCRLRYLWQASPPVVPLYGVEGLPVTPFNLSLQEW